MRAPFLQWHDVALAEMVEERTGLPTVLGPRLAGLWRQLLLAALETLGLFQRCRNRLFGKWFQFEHGFARESLNR